MGNQICLFSKEEPNEGLTPQQKQQQIHQSFIKYLEDLKSEFPQLKNLIAQYLKQAEKDYPCISQQLQNDVYIKCYFKSGSYKNAPIKKESSFQISTSQISISQLLYDKKLHTIQFQSLKKQLQQKERKQKEITSKLKLDNAYDYEEKIENNLKEHLIEIFKIFYNQKYFVHHYLKVWCKICQDVDIQDKNALIQCEKFILQLIYLLLSEIYGNFGLPKEFQCLSTIILKQMIFTLVFNKKFFIQKNCQFFELHMKKGKQKNSQNIIDQIYHVNSPIDKYYAFYKGNQEIQMNESITSQDQRENLIMKFLRNYEKSEALYYQLVFIEEFKDFFEDIVSLNWYILQNWKTVAHRFLGKQKQ